MGATKWDFVIRPKNNTIVGLEEMAAALPDYFPIQAQAIRMTGRVSDKGNGLIFRSEDGRTEYALDATGFQGLVADGHTLYTLKGTLNGSVLSMEAFQEYANPSWPLFTGFALIVIIPWCGLMWSERRIQSAAARAAAYFRLSQMGLARACGLLLMVGMSAGVVTCSGNVNDSGVTVATTVLASINSAEALSNAVSSNPTISSDGRFIAFESEATNLTGIPITNGRRHIYVRDIATGETVLASVNTAAGEGNGDSRAPAISGDGRFVAFESDATDIVLNDTNGVTDVFVRDLLIGTTFLVSVDVVTGNPPADAASRNPEISDDGNFVVFESDSNNLFAGFGDNNGGGFDIFRRNISTNTTILVTDNGIGDGANATAVNAAVSGDGTRVVFESNATNLGVAGLGAPIQIYLEDLGGGGTSVVSRSSAPGNVLGDGNSSNPSISADGTVVAYASGSTNLVPEDTGTESDIFVRVVATQTTEIMSVHSSGVQAGQICNFPRLNGTGTRVAFRSSATNLINSDTNQSFDVFIHDRIRMTTFRVSVVTFGAEANGHSGIDGGLDFSTNGLFIAFDSFANNIADNDFNGVQDIFRRGPILGQ